MYDHTFLNSQTTRSDIRPHIKSAVSLVIAYGHSDLPWGLCGYVWVTILTLSPLRVLYLGNHEILGLWSDGNNYSKHASRKNVILFYVMVQEWPCAMRFLYDNHSSQKQQHKKTTIHQVTTMLATSKNVLFPGHNHRYWWPDTTGRVPARGIIKVKVHQHWCISRWLWPGNRTFLEVATMVVTWWIGFFCTVWVQWDFSVIITGDISNSNNNTITLANVL